VELWKVTDDFRKQEQQQGNTLGFKRKLKIKSKPNKEDTGSDLDEG
jgi:hypothetical protein